jgi:hypothetical protein
MNPKVINPYAALGADHKEVLDYLIANLPPNPTFDDLNAQVSAFFFTPDPQNPNISGMVADYSKTVLPHAYNGYVNGRATDAIFQKDGICSQMLNGINNIPAESIGEYLSGIEETIPAGNFTVEEQIPLFAAIALGKGDHEYWMAQVTTPGTWAAYLNADPAINYMHVAGWVSAAMQGALLAYGIIKPPQIQIVDILSASIGSAGLAAGKVIFGWIGGRYE